MEIRRLLVIKDVIYSEAGRNAPRPICLLYTSPSPRDS